MNILGIITCHTPAPSLRCGGKELCLLDDARSDELYFEKLSKNMSEQRYAADKTMGQKSSVDLNDD